MSKSNEEKLMRKPPKPEDLISDLPPKQFEKRKSRPAKSTRRNMRHFENDRSRGDSSIGEERVLYDLKMTYRHDRQKFPTTKYLLAALMEKVEELSQALLDNEMREDDLKQNIYEEALQVAAVALRIALEGSAEFSYEFDYTCNQNFRTDKDGTTTKTCKIGGDNLID